MVLALYRTFCKGTVVWVPEAVYVLVFMGTIGYVVTAASIATMMILVEAHMCAVSHYITFLCVALYFVIPGPAYHYLVVVKSQLGLNPNINGESSLYKSLTNVIQVLDSDKGDVEDNEHQFAVFSDVESDGDETVVNSNVKDASKLS